MRLVHEYDAETDGWMVDQSVMRIARGGCDDGCLAGGHAEKKDNGRRTAKE